MLRTAIILAVLLEDEGSMNALVNFLILAALIYLVVESKHTVRDWLLNRRHLGADEYVKLKFIFFLAFVLLVICCGIIWYVATVAVAVVAGAFMMYRRLSTE